MIRLLHTPSVVSALLCALFAGSFPVCAASAETGGAIAPRSADPTSVHLLRSAFRDDLVYVKVSLNGSPEAWMELDTGTTPSIVVASQAHAAGVQLVSQGKTTEGFGSEKIETSSASGVSVRTGNERAREIEFDSIEVPGMADPEGHPLSGLLGHSFLEGKIVVIDYPNEKLFFRDTPEERGAIDVPMRIVNGLPLVRIALDGHELSALIDSGGDYGLLVTPMALKQAGLEQYLESTHKVGTSGHGGQHAAVVGAAPVLTVGHLVVHDLTAVYTTLGTVTLPAGASLGKDFLKHYRVTLDYASGTARFEPSQPGR